MGSLLGVLSSFLAKSKGKTSIHPALFHQIEAILSLSNKCWRVEVTSLGGVWIILSTVAEAAKMDSGRDIQSQMISEKRNSNSREIKPLSVDAECCV